jgi:hypothetical protein
VQAGQLEKCQHRALTVHLWILCCRRVCASIACTFQRVSHDLLRASALYCCIAVLPVHVLKQTCVRACLAAAACTHLCAWTWYGLQTGAFLPSNAHADVCRT